MEPNTNKARLDDLPSSEDKEFWAEAEIHTGIVPKPTFLDENHCFIRMTGRRAQCNHCFWGFELDPGDKIIDGHLVSKSGKLIK